MSEDTTILRTGCAVAGGVILLVGAIACNPMRVIDEGHVGLVTEFGKARDDLRGPGVTWHNPFTQDVIEVEVRTRASQFKDIDAATLEQQSLKVTGTINYALAQINIVELYRTVGLGFIERVFDSSRDSSVKTVTARFPVSTILARRQELQDGVKEQMNGDLQKHGIVVTDVFITNLTFSPEYNASVEKKQVEQQNAERETQITRQVVEKANQREEEAKGVARANAQLRESLTPEQMLENKKLDKWDGHLPQVQGNTTPLITINPQATPAAR